MRFLFCLCLLFSVLAPGVSLAYGDERAEVRVIHAAADVGAVDVYLGEAFAGRLEFGMGGQLVSVPQGSVPLRLLAPESGEPLFTGEFAARDGQVINAVVMGTGESLSLQTYPVDRSPLPWGMSRVNVINAAHTLESAAVTAVPDAGAALPLAEGLAYAASAPSEIPVGEYSLQVTDSLLPQYPEFSPAMSYTLVLLDSADAELPAAFRIFKNATQVDGPAGNLRFAQLSGFTYILTVNDVYVSYMFSGMSTAYMALPPGRYEVALYARDAQIGSGAPLLESTVELAENAWMTGVVPPYGETLSLVYYDDDLSAPPTGDMRLTVINTHPEAVSVSVDGEAAADSIPSGSMAVPLSLTAAAHDITVNAGSTSMYLAVDVLPDSPFNVYTLVVGETEAVMLSACAVK